VKRICLLGAVVAAVLILGVASALAATSHAAKKKASSGGKNFACVSALALQAPANDTNITPDAQDGIEAGAATCPSPLGKGVEFLKYTTADSGDLTGQWQQWFNAGTMFGTFTLTPSSSLPTDSNSFSASSYTGTFKVKGGSGAGAKASGKGTLKCTTQDAVHFICRESGRVTL
jgi:hypothetical protein